MARRRDFKAEYERRKARGLASGKTLQQSRGHRPQEHIIRREREREEFGLSSSELRSMREWTRRYSNKERDVEDVIEQAREKGYVWFQYYRKTWNAVRRQYLKELSSGKWSSRGLEYLAYLQEDMDLPEMAWAYYH